MTKRKEKQQNGEIFTKTLTTTKDPPPQIFLAAFLNDVRKGRCLI
jgi:hypothetical protein